MKPKAGGIIISSIQESKETNMGTFQRTDTDEK